jgi:hypothetical protein
MPGGSRLTRLNENERPCTLPRYSDATAATGSLLPAEMCRACFGNIYSEYTNVIGYFMAFLFV